MNNENGNTNLCNFFFGGGDKKRAKHVFLALILLEV